MAQPINIPIDIDYVDENLIESTTISSDTLLRSLLDEIKDINHTLDAIKERVTVLEKHNNELGNVLTNHIHFITHKYETYKSSMDYIKDKVNSFTVGWFNSSNSRNEIQYNSI